LAEVLRETIRGDITPEVKAATDFVRIKHFEGPTRPTTRGGIGHSLME